MEHIGTQYMVTSNANEVSIAVREGGIRYLGKSGTVTSHALKNEAELIKINRSGLASRRTIPTSGEQWRWVNNIAPDFSTEGKSLLMILNWAARETGRQISFATEEIRQQAEAETKPFKGNVPIKSGDRNLDHFIQDTVGLSSGFVVSELDSSHIMLDRK